jgi:hypothetical protein
MDFSSIDAITWISLKYFAFNQKSCGASRTRGSARPEAPLME